MATFFITPKIERSASLAGTGRGQAGTTLARKKIKFFQGTFFKKNNRKKQKKGIAFSKDTRN